MTISERLDRVERILTTHMEESGGIRADLAWIKKAIWACVGACLTFNVGLVTFVLTKMR